MMFCRAHNYVTLQAREENEKKLCLPVLPCLSQTQYGGSTVIPSDIVLISLCLLSPPAFVVLNFNQQVASWQLTKKKKKNRKPTKQHKGLWSCSLLWAAVFTPGFMDHQRSFETFPGGVRQDVMEPLGDFCFNSTDRGRRTKHFQRQHQHLHHKQTAWNIKQSKGLNGASAVRGVSVSGPLI